ncbi:host cell division inhibitor Icd-like protein [Yersinia enterocolitica]|nr:host cell division inhibitor Icd-like protein [Yersinia enterocolitica]EKN6168289.1 host cell division inhibitor Icd-like protein [Yersinia enterocolitica]EKN6294139.1 host cell division inhibitor Icd-like protein [Yersinia enterocolitica]EKN6398434.1 host cell division inhibitor Icd-like protein [Yersinia enterocolitica]EKN6412016.1 host cell division inhibitor Icd-like protein [Yersinia enterocolitica]
MMPITQAATLNRLSLSESHTNPVISGQLQKTLQETFGYLQTSLNSLILSKSAIGVSRVTKHEQYSGSGKEKGSTVNATLLGYSDGSALAFLRWRRLISLCMAVTINCPVVSPSSFTNSIASTTSCGARACTFCDFALIAFVATAEISLYWWRTVYTKNNSVKLLTCLHLSSKVDSTLTMLRYENSEAQKDGSPLWASNHNVNEAYTMALQHSTQTRPKFQYLFLAVCRSDLNAKPHRESVTAHSEQDARRTLAGQFVLSFAGRIPAQGVCNA